MAKQTTDQLSNIYYLDLKDLKGLPYKTQITPTEVGYSTGSRKDVIRIVQEAKRNDQRVRFTIHDQTSNMMIQLGSNTGHSVGTDPDYILDYGSNPVESLDEALQDLVLMDREIEIDWFLVDVISDWRKK